jgi:GNAT superfamily N-acetyltransferase
VTFVIRPAALQDADQAVGVLRDSITLLCVDDHQNDPATLEHWLRNKTTAEFERWLTDPERLVLVSEWRSTLCGVGSIHRSGELRLLYVRPGMQRQGVGAALLGSLEAHAREWGLSVLELGSSSGARAFYERCGYLASGGPTPGFGISYCFPYRKPLQM